MTDRPDPAFVPISPNPFIVGNPVRGRTMFFGRAAEFELVRKRVEHSDQGALLVFCGERRSGKTSILFQILDRRLGPDFIPVLIDMQSMAVGSELEFLERLSEEIVNSMGGDGEAISRSNLVEGSSRAAVFRKFVHEALRKNPGKKLILLFDEYELFEDKIDAGVLDEDVLHVLASLMENQPVFLIFTGSQHIEQRRKEYWKILAKSALFKRISYLERDDALSLIQKPVEGRVEYGEGVVDAIYRLGAGQPFYTQAVCQSLVDRLNEHHSRLVVPQTLADVVDAMINNPLPQMIFLWDGLEHDEKLALALLAEVLTDGTAYSGIDPILRHLKRRGYPLKLERSRLATSLESLFKSEMLLRRDQADQHEYAFRMDLWRLWIRRQHSVWQVMREVGIDIRVDPWWKKPAAQWAGRGVAVVGAIVLILVLTRKHDGGDRALGADPLLTGRLRLEPVPASALIRLNGRTVSIGTYLDTLVANTPLKFQLSAPGHADTELVMRLSPGVLVDRHVELRLLTGSLRIETRPPGAEIRLDDVAIGRSPATVHQISAATPHRVTASLPGFGEVRQEVAVRPDTTITATLLLQAGTYDLMVTTDPSGSQVRLDGTPQGDSPLLLHGLSAAAHTFSASRDGYASAETTVVVNEGTRRVRLGLARKPPGVLIVQGDRPGEFYLDDDLVVQGVQHFRREVAEGTHQVRVVFSDGRTIDKSVNARSGELTTYDYSHDSVERHPLKGP